MLNVKHDGRIYCAEDTEGLAKLGVPDTVIQTLVLEQRANDASAECRRRIYSIASAETQMNMATATALVSSKTAASRSDDEKAIITGLAAATDWVKQMRVAAKTLVADVDADIHADVAWPDCPAMALAVVDQF